MRLRALNRESEIMNEESVSMIDNVLAENIEKFSGALGSAVDFTIEQAPEIIQQALYWNLIESGIHNLIGIILIMPIIILAKVYFDIMNSRPEEEESAKSNKYWEVKVTEYSHCSNSVTVSEKIDVEVLLCALMFSSCCSIFGLILINFTFIKIWVAPKLWLLEYASSLVK